MSVQRRDFLNLYKHGKQSTTLQTCVSVLPGHFGGLPAAHVGHVVVHEDHVEVREGSQGVVTGKWETGYNLSFRS